MQRPNMNDLEYHKWCKSICEKHGWILCGANGDGGGCSIYKDDRRTYLYEIPDFILKALASA